MRTIVKWANVGCILLGCFFCVMVWYFAMFTTYLNGESMGDSIYLHIATFISSHGFLVGSIMWMKYRIENNV